MKKSNSVKNLTIENIRAYTTETLVKTIEHHGCIQPTFICFGRERTVPLIASQLANDDVKDHFVSTLRLICIAEDALAAVLVAEIWTSPVCSIKNDIRPSLAADRQEYVMIRIELPGNQGEMNLFPIIRDANGKASLGTCISQPIKDCPSRPSRFENFLPSTAPTKNERIAAESRLKRNGQLIKVYPFQ